jgi:hypothetical protein
MKFIHTFLFLVAINVLWAAPPEYDGYEDAVDLTQLVDSLIIWNSADDDIVYTTTDATLDGPIPSCLGTKDNSNANVWFKYKVSATELFKFDVITTDVPSPMGKAYISIWTDSVTTDTILNLIQIECSTPPSLSTVHTVIPTGLIEDQYYYIMVHPKTPNFTGDFEVEITSFNFEFETYPVTRDMSPEPPEGEDYVPELDSGEYVVCIPTYYVNDPNNYGLCFLYGHPSCNDVITTTCSLDPVKDEFGNFIGRVGCYGTHLRQQYYVYNDGMLMCLHMRQNQPQL